MAITLKKGQKLSLSKEGLTKATVGLGWLINQYDTGENADLDSSVFMLGEDGKVPSDVDRIIFTVNIFRGKRKGQSFDKIENAFIRVVDDRDDTELVHYNLTENFKDMHSVVAGEIYLHNGEWRFAAIGEGFNTDDIDELASRFA